MSSLELIDTQRIPQHIAVIMDGNGRWARERGAIRIFGHRNAIQAVRETTEACAELGVKYLTLFAFSTENWSRPKQEVDALMELLVNTISGETKTLMENDVKLHAIGNLANLPDGCKKSLDEAIAKTANNKRMTLSLALNYSGRWEIVEAVKTLAQKVCNQQLKPEDITELTIAQHLNSWPMPDPELLIRTSGELRISNFLLWESAYTEFYFTKTFWPDFRKENLYKAIVEFQSRERRFGKVLE